MKVKVSYNNCKTPAWEIGFDDSMDLDASDGLIPRFFSMMLHNTCDFSLAQRDILPCNSQFYFIITEHNGVCQDKIGSRKYFYHRDFRHVLVQALKDPQLCPLVEYIFDFSSGCRYTNIDPNSVVTCSSMLMFNAVCERRDGRTVEGLFGIPEHSPEEGAELPHVYEPAGSFGIFSLCVSDENINLIKTTTRVLHGCPTSCCIDLFVGKVGDESGVFISTNGEYRLICGYSDSTQQYLLRDVIGEVSQASKNETFYFDSNGVNLDDINFQDVIIRAGTAKLDISKFSLNTRTYREAENTEKNYLDAFNKVFDIKKDICIITTNASSERNEIDLTFNPKLAEHTLELCSDSDRKIDLFAKFENYEYYSPDKHGFFSEGYYKVNRLRIRYTRSDEIITISLDETKNMEVICSKGDRSYRVKFSELLDITDKSMICRADYPFTEDECRYSQMHLRIQSVVERSADFLKLMEKIAVVFSNEKYKGLFLTNAVTECDSVEESVKPVLYSEDKVPDREIVKKVSEAVKKFRLTGKIPNVMITGSAGTGKTTLLKNIAKCFPDQTGKEPEVLIRSALSLQGKYVGHTESRVFDLLKEADEKKAIIVIDEAYVLLDSKFGEEALSMLLPIMTGDRTTIDKVADLQNSTKAEKYEFKNGAPAIWMSGYDTELRNMMARNQGLYRRYECKIKLRSPSAHELFEALKRYAEVKLPKIGNISEIKINLLMEAFEFCKDEILSFFRFGISCENEISFGNYAGMESFCNSCAAEVDEERNISDVKNCISRVIESKKTELNEQYQAVVLAGDNKDNRFAFKVENDSTGSFGDLIGLDSVKKELRTIIDMMSGQNDFTRCGIRIPKGVLLAGYPGCGKTAIARAAAGELQRAFTNKSVDKNVAFVPVSAAEILADRRGSVNAVKALFAEARMYDVAVIFIDEIDAIGRRREENPYYPALLELMKEMDGFEKCSNVLVIAATNAPEALDDALTRPKRFDRTFRIEFPEKSERKSLIRFFINRIEGLGLNEDEVDEFAEKFSERTNGFSPALLENIINSAACLNLNIANSDPALIEENFPHRASVCKPNCSGSAALENFLADVSETMDSMFIGASSPALKEDKFSVDENDGCSAVAIHEVGHGLVSILCSQKPFEKITITPRGGALGYVVEDRSKKLRTKKQYLDSICVKLGGRIAEEIFYGEDNISVGAAQDIKESTNLARMMIETWGMSDEFGTMSLTAPAGRYVNASSFYTCSDNFREQADNEVRKQLAALYERTKALLTKNAHILEALAEFVFNKETVYGDEFLEEYKRISEQNKLLSENCVLSYQMQ